MPPNMGNHMTLKRIHREIADLKKEDLGDITLGPRDMDNPYLWKARLPGPEGSVYEGGMFEVDVQLANDYPFTAPKVLFLTRIYHMNISERGNVCIDILKHNWSPALSVFKLVLSLSSLLTDPNPQDPLVPTIAREYLSQRAKHDATARRWTSLYASSSTPAPPVPPPPVASSAPAPSSPPVPLPSHPTPPPAHLTAYDRVVAAFVNGHALRNGNGNASSSASVSGRSTPTPSHPYPPSLSYATAYTAAGSSSSSIPVPVHDGNTSGPTNGRAKGKQRASPLNAHGHIVSNGAIAGSIIEIDDSDSDSDSDSDGDGDEDVQEVTDVTDVMERRGLEKEKGKGRKRKRNGKALSGGQGHGQGEGQGKSEGQGQGTSGGQGPKRNRSIVDLSVDSDDDGEVGVGVDGEVGGVEGKGKAMQGAKRRRIGDGAGDSGSGGGTGPAAGPGAGNDVIVIED